MHLKLLKLNYESHLGSVDDNNGEARAQKDSAFDAQQVTLRDTCKLSISPLSQSWESQHSPLCRKRTTRRLKIYTIILVEINRSCKERTSKGSWKIMQIIVELSKQTLGQGNKQNLSYLAIIQNPTHKQGCKRHLKDLSFRVEKSRRW